MYNVPYFKAENQAAIIAFMQAHPFIVLCGCNKANQPVATHIPVLIEEREGKIFLQAHVMRKQNHTQAFEENPKVLAIFSGAHSYVSASWYQKKDVASTWNYQAVHANGILHWKDEAFLYTLLDKLTANFETDKHWPALVEKMQEDYVRSLMKAIAGFEIEITGIEHVFKLSQNRDEKSYSNIIDQLKNGDADAKLIATQMQNNHHVFLGNK